MHIETIKLPVYQLTFGMTVVKLDRPWSETPFMLQGFRIKTAEELRLLSEYCSHVYVDVGRTQQTGAARGERVTLDEHGEIVAFQRSISAAVRDAPPPPPSSAADLPAPAVRYVLESSFHDELPHARAALEQTKCAMKKLIEALRGGLRCNLDEVKLAASALEDSMLRNPDPAMLMRALRNPDPFSFRHCVHSAILAINLGRALGLRRQTIHELAMGVLLADLGKMRLPKELLRTTRRLDRRETDIMKLHVRFGVEIVEDLGGVTPGAIEIVATHHERFDGSGYPKGLRGGEISLLARIAGLADTFDAITSDRTYSRAIAPHEAVQELYAATVDVFQRGLVELLIQVLGAHPLGSLVELSDGSVAVVLALNRERRLLPWVLQLTAADKQRLQRPTLLNLAAGERPLATIKDVLEPGAHGVDQPGVEVLAA